MNDTTDYNNLLSVCMIVKNEESTLPRLMDKLLELADEIIIVDTGSTDNTIKYLTEVKYKLSTSRNYNHRLHDPEKFIIDHYRWDDNFSNARNYSISKVTSKYWMWIDSDDDLAFNYEKLSKVLLENLETHIDMFKCSYVLGSSTDNKLITYQSVRERIMRTSSNYKFIGSIHEVIPQDPNKTLLLRSDTLVITHNPLETHDSSERNLNILKRNYMNKTLLSRELYYYGKELYHVKDYSGCINLLREYLETDDRYIGDVLGAYILMSRCHRLLYDNLSSYNSIMKTFEYATNCPSCYYELCSFYYNQLTNMISLSSNSSNFKKIIKPICTDLIRCCHNLESMLVNSDPMYKGIIGMTDDYIKLNNYLYLSVGYYYLDQISESICYNNLVGKLDNTNLSYLRNLQMYNTMFNK